MPPSQLNRPIAAGVVASAIAVAAVTGLIFGLREVMPVAGAGVLYLLPVLLASTGWGVWLGVLDGGCERGRLQLLPHPTDRALHGRRRGELGRPGVFLVVAAVTSKLADAARSRAAEAESRRARRT